MLQEVEDHAGTSVGSKVKRVEPSENNVREVYEVIIFYTSNVGPCPAVPYC